MITIYEKKVIVNVRFNLEVMMENDKWSSLVGTFSLMSDLTFQFIFNILKFYLHLAPWTLVMNEDAGNILERTINNCYYTHWIKHVNASWPVENKSAVCNSFIMFLIDFKYMFVGWNVFSIGLNLGLVKLLLVKIDFFLPFQVRLFLSCTAIHLVLLPVQK